jgi:hypothetical protein
MGTDYRSLDTDKSIIHSDVNDVLKSMGYGPLNTGEGITPAVSRELQSRAGCDENEKSAENKHN